MKLANQSSAEVLQQEKYEHQRNHAAIANQDENAQHADDNVSEADERPKRDEILRGGGRICTERDSVGGGHHSGTVEDGVQADDGLHKNQQAKEPERELVTSVRVVETLRQDAVEHVVIV